MDQYEHIFRAIFGESLTARMMFILALALFVGVPYLIRTWRELRFAKHQIDLHWSEVELLSALFGLAEKVGTAEDITIIRETARQRLQAIRETIRSAKTPAERVALEYRTTATLNDRLQMTAWLIFGSLLSFLTTLLLPGIGLLVMLVVAAVCIGTGKLRSGTMQRRAFYAGVTYIAVGELLFIIAWGVRNSP